MAGRRKGKPNKTNAVMRDHILAHANPVSFLIKVMNGEAFSQPIEKIDAEGKPILIYPNSDQRIAAAVQLLPRVAPEIRPIDMPVSFSLDDITEPKDILVAINNIIQLIANGEITPERAKTLTEIIESAREAMDTDILAAELEELRERVEVMESGEA